jgi:hypothetical protein
MIEWLCTQEILNPEVAIIFGAAARYRRATAGSSHDDAHPDNSTLHTGAIRPHTGFVVSLFFIFFRTGHGSSQVFEMLPDFCVFRGRALFVQGMMHSYLFSSGPVEAEGGTSVLSRRAGSSGVSWRTLTFCGENSTSPLRWL